MPTRDVIVGALARVGWYALDVPCAWCLRTDERAACAWKDDDDEGMDEDYETSLLFSSASANASMREILEDGRAERVRHMNGKMFDAHLEEVAALLRAWGAPEAVSVAGLGHTVYGSEAFPVRLKRFVDRKSTRAAVGTWAERLMFAYATTSQRKWYRAMVSEEFDGGRGESTPTTSKFTANNFYTGERREMSDLEGAMLTLMHAADVYSVLKRDVEADEMRVAVGFVLRLIVVASEGVQRAARQTANVNVRNALTKLHRYLSETVVRDIVSSSVRRASISNLLSIRDSGIEAATKTLRRARTDAGLVLRATGVV